MSVKSVKRPATSGILLAASAAVALAAFDQSPAYANDAFLRGFVGGMVGGMVGNMLMQQRFHGGGGYGHRPAPARSGGAAYSHSRPTGNGAPPSPEELSRALASLAPPTTQEEQVILKSVTPGQSLGAVGASDDLDQIGKDYNADANRDYTGRVDEVIKPHPGSPKRPALDQGGGRHRACDSRSAEYFHPRRQTLPVRDVSGRELVARTSARDDSRSGPE